jgi:esterase
MLSFSRIAPEGPVRHPALLIAHGLFGSARNWGALARRLAAGRDVIAVDMRNHGESPWHATHSYPDMAADLARVIVAHGAPMDVLGHSMGGKAAMWLALTEGALVRRLVVADIAPVAYRHDNSRHIAAMRGLDLTPPLSRTEADRRLQATVPEAAIRAFLLQSLDLRAIPPRWRLNLDALERALPLIVGWPEIHGRFTGLTLFLSGALSHYVLPEYRAEILSLFPKARFAKLPDAGHWLHADQPQAFAAAVEVFLTSPER